MLSRDTTLDQATEDSAITERLTLVKWCHHIMYQGAEKGRYRDAETLRMAEELLKEANEKREKAHDQGKKADEQLKMAKKLQH